MVQKSTPVKPAPDSTRRSEKSRRAIYEAALALIGEVGYQKTTIEGIAARAGVGKQTIYRWWSSKGDVLMEAFVDLSEQAAEAAAPGQAYVIPDTGDLAADLKAVLRLTVDQLLDPVFAVPSRGLAAEGLINEELGRRYVAKLLEPSLQLYVQRLRAAQEAGQVRAGHRPPYRPRALRLPARPALAPAHRADLVRVHGHPRRLRPGRDRLARQRQELKWPKTAGNKSC